MYDRECAKALKGSDYMDERATEKQIDFATRIAETLGIELPEENTKETYCDFISENLDEFEQVQKEIRYKDNYNIHFGHSYTLASRYNGDQKLNINPDYL